MFKRIACISALAFCLVLSACSTESSKSYTYSVDTGDSIKISVDTAQDYDISSDVPFTITCGDDEVFSGSFIYSDAYDEYRTAYDMEDTAELIAEGEKDGNEYFAFALPDEVDYFVRIANSYTAIAMGSVAGEDAAAAAFDAMTISLAD